MRFDRIQTLKGNINTDRKIHLQRHNLIDMHHLILELTRICNNPRFANRRQKAALKTLKDFDVLWKTNSLKELHQVYIRWFR